MNCQGVSLPHSRERLSHALLISAQSAQQMQALAADLSAWLLCSAPTEDGACGSCRACRLFRAGNHADYHLLTLSEDSQTITIAQVQAFCASLKLSAQCSHVGVIEQAHLLNSHAAASLLKTLEEPPADVYFILLTHRPGLLPITIRSRCHSLKLPPQGDAYTRLHDLDTTALSLWLSVVRAEADYTATKQWIEQGDPHQVFGQILIFLSQKIKETLPQDIETGQKLLRLHAKISDCYRMVYSAGVQASGLYDRLFIISLRAGRSLHCMRQWIL